MIKFSDLDVCKQFSSKDKTKILKYIETLYSKDSPLNSIQNLNERKLEACRQAKMSVSDEASIEIMDMKNKEVNKLIFAFLAIHQNNNLLTQLFQKQQLLWDIQQLLLDRLTCLDENELNEKYIKRVKLSDTADDLARSINRIFGEIFSTAEVKDIASPIIRQMLRPEERLKMRDDAAA